MWLLVTLLNSRQAKMNNWSGDAAACVTYIARHWRPEALEWSSSWFDGFKMTCTF